MSYTVRKWRHNNKLWRDLRPLIFARDGGMCQLRMPGCTLDAQEVDHIIRPEDGGPRYDPSNLRSSCKHCNASRGGTVGARIVNARHHRRHKQVPPSRKW